jgi:1,4-alpha-glucan branching enzyme
MAEQATTKKKVSFSLLAPEAQTVMLAADFNEWGQNPISMKKQKGGQWKTTVSLPRGSYQYLFLVDGQWRDDPKCSTRMPNPYGGENCVRVVE